MKIVAAIAVALLLWTAAGVSLMLLDNQNRDPALSAKAQEGLQQLFKIASDFHGELEAAVGRAEKLSEEDKKSVRQILRDRAFQFGLLRAYYQRATSSHRAYDALNAISLMSAAVDTPYAFRTYKVGSGYVDLVNTTKLESLEDEFKVIATRMLKDTF